MAYTPYNPRRISGGGEICVRSLSQHDGAQSQYLGLYFPGKKCYHQIIQSETKKEAEPIDNELYIQHISQMLRGFREEPLRAVYMVVQQLHRLQGL